MTKVKRLFKFPMIFWRFGSKISNKPIWIRGVKISTFWYLLGIRVKKSSIEIYLPFCLRSSPFCQLELQLWGNILPCIWLRQHCLFCWFLTSGIIIFWKIRFRKCMTCMRNYNDSESAFIWRRWFWIVTLLENGEI